MTALIGSSSMAMTSGATSGSTRSRAPANGSTISARAARQHAQIGVGGERGVDAVEHHLGLLVPAHHVNGIRYLLHDNLPG